MSTISDLIPDINVIEPGDKIILATNTDSRERTFELCNQVESFLASEHRVLAINHFDVYIIKQGAILLLRDKAREMSREMRLSLYGDRHNIG